MIIYSLHNRPMMYSGQKLGSCITEGYDREKVLRDAEDWFAQNAVEMDYGTEDMLLQTYNTETGEETTEEVVVTWRNSDRP